LRANAKHGRPRSDKDLRRAYRLAVQHDLVKAWDVDGVAKLLACTEQWARRLTQDVREARDAELRQKMHELREQGLSQRVIAETLGFDRQIVRTYLDSLKPAKKAAGLERNSFEETHLEDQFDPAAEPEIIEQVDAWDRPINADDDYGIPLERDEGPAEPVYSTGADGLPQAEMFAEVATEAEPAPEPEDEAEPAPAAEHLDAASPGLNQTSLARHVSCRRSTQLPRVGRVPAMDLQGAGNRFLPFRGSRPRAWGRLGKTPGLVPGVQPDLEPAVLAPRVDDGRRAA
jgi:hypothetical protein